MCVAFRSNQSNETSIHRKKKIKQYHSENKRIPQCLYNVVGLYNIVCHHSAESDWILLFSYFLVIKVACFYFHCHGQFNL